MSASNKIIQAAAGNVADSAVVPDGLSFGENQTDYLTRSSDLSGNTDGKQFTFSFWLYASQEGTTVPIIYGYSGSDYRILIRAFGSGAISYASVRIRNSSNTDIFNCTLPFIARKQWNHYLISFDLDSTSKRHVYVNNINQISGTTFTTYTNATADRTFDKWGIGADPQDGNPSIVRGRLAHVFMDYTYRDLTQSSNRELFITSDNKPADNQDSLSPILYLPLNDPDDAGSNLGTGGDFTVSGVFARAGRGPNQYNCVASRFDGANDQLSSTSLGSITNGKTLTFCAIFDIETYVTHYPIDTGADAPIYQPFRVILFSDGLFEVRARDTVYPFRFQSTETIPLNQMNFLQVSVDLSDTSKRHALLNNRAVSGSWLAYNNDNIHLNEITSLYIGKPASGNAHDGALGEIWLSQDYIDLETDNPFWDSDTDRPKPIRQVLDETSYTPILALPVSGGENEPGINLGTGGDLTVASDPFQGARGMSEDITRAVRFSTTQNNATEISLSKTGISVDGNSGWSGVMAFRRGISGNRQSASAYEGLFQFKNSTTNRFSGLRLSSDESIYFYSYDENGGFSNVDTNLNFTNNGANDPGYWEILFFNFNISTNRIYLYNMNDYAADRIKNLGVSSHSWTQNFNQINIGYNTKSFFGSMAGIYIAMGNIDFSQESNRNKYVDQLGYMRDLSQDIDNGDIPEPVVYLKFDDATNLGKNTLGTIGDLTNTSVTITDDFSRG